MPKRRTFNLCFPSRYRRVGEHLAARGGTSRDVAKLLTVARERGIKRRREAERGYERGRARKKKTGRPREPQGEELQAPPRIESQPSQDGAEEKGLTRPAPETERMSLLLGLRSARRSRRARPTAQTEQEPDKEPAGAQAKAYLQSRAPRTTFPGRRGSAWSARGTPARPGPAARPRSATPSGRRASKAVRRAAASQRTRQSRGAQGGPAGAGRPCTRVEGTRKVRQGIVVSDKAERRSRPDRRRPSPPPLREDRAQLEHAARA